MADDSGEEATTVVAMEMSRLVAPLNGAIQAASEGREEELFLLLDDMGIGEIAIGTDISAVKEVLSNAQGAFSGINSLLTTVSKGETPSPDEIEKTLVSLQKVFENVSKLEDIDVMEVEDVDNLADAVVDYLIVRYLRFYHPRIYAPFCLAGVITHAEAERPPSVDLERIGDLLSEPGKIPEEMLGWGTPEFKAYFLIRYLHVFASDFVPAAAIEPSDRYDEVVNPSKAKRNYGYQLNLPFLDRQTQAGRFEVGANVLPVPGKDDLMPGLALMPYGKYTIGDTEDLGNGWTFSYETSAESADWALTLQPEADDPVPKPDIRLLGSGKVLDELSAEAELEYDPESDDTSEGGKTPIIGTADGTNLAYRYASVRAELEATGDEVDLVGEVPVGATLTVRPKGGFLEKVLPPKIAADFDLTPGVSLQKGFYFDGSVKLKVPIPINQSLGPITLKEIYIEVAIDLDTGHVEPTVAVSADGKIGPIGATIKRVGIDGRLAFPENRDGNLGIADLNQEFKPPSGVGLSLDRGPISGGGYIEYEPENERYAGVFQVKIGPVNVKIMGLLTTEFPDGSDGFSLLLSIYGEFPPVQLSFGFTLNGLGGVIGVNRSLKPEPLGKAVRSGNMGSVLFPEDPVANAQRIVSDLRSIYPPTRGQHVFGPMARFGWGTPPIIYWDLGVVLQLPKLKIVLLGKLTVGLPTIEMPKAGQMIRLNLAIAGSILPNEQLVRVDASLYDSRVMLWSVKGDMAARIRWGDEPRFLMGVGGFNPKFPVPSDFPKLTTVTVSISLPVPTPTIEWKGYFATTSNTVQVGASFEAEFEAGPVEAKGWWGLDALFQFEPFKFVVNFSAGLKVSVFGKSLSAKLNGTIKGPSPVHITGKLSVKTPGPLPDPSPNVDITVGESKPKDDQLPTANVLPKFRDELADPANWSVQMPEGGQGIVSLREIPEDDGEDSEVLAHPMGKPSVRQTLVPVGREIERFGKNRPKHSRYDFSLAPEGSAESLPSMDAALKEAFAPNQFRKMSDSEKLNAPPFKRWEAGTKTGNDLFYWGCVVEKGGTETERPGNAASARLTYEHKQYDTEVEDHVQATSADGGAPDTGTSSDGYPVDVARSLADDGAVANADTRWTGEQKFVPEGPDEDPVSVASNFGDLDGGVGVIDDGTVLDEPDEVGRLRRTGPPGTGTGGTGGIAGGESE